MKTLLCLLTISLVLAPIGARQEPGKETPMQNGLQITLKPGQAVPDQPEEPKKSVPTAALDGKSTQTILQGLPAFEHAAQQTEFALRPSSSPPPKTAETIKDAFPQKETLPPPTPISVPDLEVLRHSPDGKMNLLNKVSIVFSQPMVPLTSIDENLKVNPVEMVPQPEGKWRWLDPKTLVFENNARFPKATVYKFRVPKGLKSELGGVLQAEYSFSIETPPPSVEQFGPQGNGWPLDPYIWIVFDQRVEALSVLAKAQLKGNNRLVPFSMVSQPEWMAMANFSHFKDRKDQVIILKLQEKLQRDTQYQFTIDAGVPSAEGLLTSQSPVHYSFKTYGPFTVEKARCGWGGRCFPGSPWTFEFSNAVGQVPETLEVSPKLENLKVWGGGNTISVQGLSRGKTTYEVTLPADLKDIYGQKLEGKRKFSFAVDSAPMMLQGPGTSFLTLDPYAKPGFNIFTTNLAKVRMRLFKVEPQDFQPYLDAVRNRQRNRKDDSFNPPGSALADKTLETGLKAEESGSTYIDLSPYMNKGKGQVLVWIEAVEPWSISTIWSNSNRKPQDLVFWVQGTQMAMDAFYDNTDMSVWVTKLKDGTPLSNVDLSMIGAQGFKGKTNDSGLFQRGLPDAGGEARVLVARLGDDLCILPESTSYYSRSSNWHLRSNTPTLLWYTFDDRNLYQVGETVSLKGYLRVFENNKLGGLHFVEPTALDYVVKDPFGNDITKGKTELSASGGFHLTFDLPAQCNLGTSTITLTINRNGTSNTVYRHAFQVQEFRRPEFEVTCQSDQPFGLVNESAQFTVEAKYYAGGVLPNADVFWQVNQSAGSFSPPGWSGFSFGTWRPWWEYYDGDYYEPLNYQGKTGPDGTDQLELNFGEVHPIQPTSLTVTASVQDVNRQTWTASKAFLVHPSDRYIGLKTDRYFVEKGQSIELQCIVVDLDGKAIPNQRIDLHWSFLDWNFRNGNWIQEEKSPQDRVLKSTDKPISTVIQAEHGGTLQISARIVDDRDRANESRMTRWITGGTVRSDRSLSQEQITLIPDKETYAVGETANVLIQSPFAPGHALVTLDHRGTLKQWDVELKEQAQSISFKIEPGWEPNINLQVDMVGSSPRNGSNGLPDPRLPARPAFAQGTLSLSVPAKDHALNVTVTPNESELEPGASSTLQISIADAQNRPLANSECAVVMVDESILALANYQLPDVLTAFFPNAWKGTQNALSRPFVHLADPDFLDELQNSGAMNEEEADGMVSRKSMAMPAPMMEMAAAAEPPAPGGRAQAGEGPSFKMRKDFNPLALFEPVVKTDGQGKAVVSFKLPDNLTRYRIMVVATQGVDRFGQGESSLTARLPLMVRPSAPRFLNFGDQFRFPVVIQNQTQEPLEVQVALRVQNLTLTGDAGLKVRVPAKDRVEVQFPAKAEMAGKAEYQVGVMASYKGHYATDAAYGQFPVWTPATTEAFALYGTLDSGSVAQPVKAPDNVFKQFGGLEITTSSTALSELTDAFIYLYDYPYGCAEQISSRMLSELALKDILRAFNSPGLPSEAALESQLNQEIKALSDMQNGDGGFGFWRRGDESWPFLTIHVTHALFRAREKDYAVPQQTLNRALDYLRKVRNHMPSFYPDSVKDALEAYALYVRKIAKENVENDALMLVNKNGLDKLGLDSCGFLLMALKDGSKSGPTRAALMKHFNNRVQETAGKAHFTTSYGEGDYLLLYSDKRTDAIICSALMGEDPKSDLIAKIIRGLMAERNRGRWGNTQENVFALLCLDQYFRIYESVTPDFVLGVWLGNRTAGSQAFKGRQTSEHLIEVPMSELSADSQNLVLAKEGAGRLYYRLGLKYAPNDLKIKAAQYGFGVERRYEAVDDPEDVQLDDQGVWHVRAGARVRVVVSMTVPERRTHVALVDPLPAGFEIINPELQPNPEPQQPSPTRKGGAGYRPWYWHWYNHQNYRTERAEAFSSLVYPGYYDYTYMTRATTPGNFVVPPSKAEEMYFPETFGRSASTKVIVE